LWGLVVRTPRGTEGPSDTPFHSVRRVATGLQRPWCSVWVPLQGAQRHLLRDVSAPMTVRRAPPLGGHPQ
jgi:hypothetical protein